MKHQRRLLGLLAIIAVVAGLWWVQGSGDPPRTGDTSSLGQMAEADLPHEGQLMLKLIDAGGPFRYRQDGSIFRNEERLLPEESRGYYREYTVDTPGSDDRGARRLVAGHDGDFYYTDDHYRSFRRVDR